jgi:hypothetical protein
MDRKSWQQPLTTETRWRCPLCGLGHLRLLHGSLKHQETMASRQAREENDDWEADWTQYRFVAMLECDNILCAEPAVVHGDGGVELDSSSYPDE